MAGKTTICQGKSSATAQSRRRAGAVADTQLFILDNYLQSCDPVFRDVASPGGTKTSVRWNLTMFVPVKVMFKSVKIKIRFNVLVLGFLTVSHSEKTMFVNIVFFDRLQVRKIDVCEHVECG